MSHANSISLDTEIAQPINTDVQPILSLDAALANLDGYRAKPVKGFDILRDNTDLCADPRVAAAFVECSIAVDRIDLAELVLPMTNDETGILSAMTFMSKDDPKSALAALKNSPQDARHQMYAFGLRIQANIRIRQYDAASKAVFDWSTAMPSSPQPFRVMGNALAQKGDKRAERWFQRAINISGGGSGAVLDMAAFLIKQGRTDEARKGLESLKYVQGRSKRRKKRLLQSAIHLADVAQ